MALIFFLRHTCCLSFGWFRLKILLNPSPLGSGPVWPVECWCLYDTQKIGCPGIRERIFQPTVTGVFGKHWISMSRPLVSRSKSTRFLLFEMENEKMNESDKVVAGLKRDCLNESDPSKRQANHLQGKDFVFPELQMVFWTNHKMKQFDGFHLPWVTSDLASFGCRNIWRRFPVRRCGMLF